MSPEPELPKSFQEARALGAPLFFTGDPCIHGHVAPRRTAGRHCTVCLKDRNAAKYAADPEYFARKNQQWHRRSQERHVARVVRQFKTLPTAVQQARRRRYKAAHKAKNPELFKQRAIQYRNVRRARLSGGGVVTIEEWEQIKAHYGYRCLCCGATQVPLEPDHVVPIARGGLNAADNIQPLCVPCNRIKFTKTIDYRVEA
jgi:5-methylcytosine-specific restriction endonuclease McrA